MPATKLILKPVSPFDFDLSAKIYSGDDRQITKYEDGKFWQVIRVDGKLVLVTINASGTVDEPKLSVKLESNERLSRARNALCLYLRQTPAARRFSFY